jgi:sugar phosphate isomerase/epimerase
MHHYLSRRNFITSTAVAAAAIAQPLQAKRKVPVALQLYSIRQDCQADLPGSLVAVAKMGYDGVEFAGYYGRNAKEVRKMLDDLKLKAFSTHIGLKTLMGDELEKTIEFSKILGNPRLTVASLPTVKTIQGWYDYAKQFNEIAAKLKKHKMQVGFHNHAGELDLMEGKRPWDVFLDNTSKDVTGQMHMQHFPAKGLDPVAYITKYRGRSRLLHLIDYAPNKRPVLLGDGVIEWKKIFDAAEKYGGVECYIVEQESYPEPLTRLQCVDRCLQNFRKLHG